MTMDTNITILTGTVVAATERTIGQQNRSLVELRLGVTRPGRRGEPEAPRDVIPLTIWDGALGAAVLGLAERTPVTVVARVGSREWNGKLYLELLAEHVTADVASAPGPDLREPTPTRPSVAEPVPAPSRPGGPSRRESGVPF